MSMSVGATVPGLLSPVPVRQRRRVLRDVAAAERISDHAVAAQAFAMFYEQNIDSLTRALNATLIDPALAADAAQEAMTRACERWATVQTHPSPVAWCYRVGMNWSTSRWRKRRREVVTAEPLDTSVACSSAVEAADDSLRNALMKLSVEQRSVVVLRIWMDWSVEATAEALDLAPGTVASRLHRALKNLRRIVEVESRRDALV